MIGPRSTVVATLDCPTMVPQWVLCFLSLPPIFPFGKCARAQIDLVGTLLAGVSSQRAAAGLMPPKQRTRATGKDKS